VTISAANVSASLIVPLVDVLAVSVRCWMFNNPAGGTIAAAIYEWGIGNLQQVFLGASAETGPSSQDLITLPLLSPVQLTKGRRVYVGIWSSLSAPIRQFRGVNPLASPSTQLAWTKPIATYNDLLTNQAVGTITAAAHAPWVQCVP